MSLLQTRRPMLTPSSGPSVLAAPGTLSNAVTSSSETLDLVGKISAHPGFAGIQIRCGPRDTYNPSHIVRKRRHGFLSRLRTKKGRKMIMRRRRMSWEEEEYFGGGGDLLLKLSPPWDY